MRSRRLANVAFVSFAMLALPRLVSAQLIPLTVTEPVAWTNLVHVVDDGTSLRKVGGCDGCQDSGAASQQQIVAGDAYAEFVASETTTIRGLGLSHFHAGTSAADLDFAIAHSIPWLSRLFTTCLLKSAGPRISVIGADSSDATWAISVTN